MWDRQYRGEWKTRKFTRSFSRVLLSIYGEESAAETKVMKNLCGKVLKKILFIFSFFISIFSESSFRLKSNFHLIFCSSRLPQQLFYAISTKLWTGVRSIVKDPSRLSSLSSLSNHLERVEWKGKGIFEFPSRPFIFANISSLEWASEWTWNEIILAFCVS